MSNRILLVVPISDSHYVVPPLGLGYLATALRSAGFDDIIILDCVKEALDFTQLKNRLKELRPHVVGFQVFSSDFLSVKRSIDMTRDLFPQSIIVAGGPHISATGSQALEDLPGLDYAIVGEGEVSLPLLIRRLLGGQQIHFDEIPGLIRRTPDAITPNERELIEDLDSLGMPAWELMPPHTYPDAPQGAFYRQFPIAPIASSRGCNYSCAFCGSPENMGKKLRFRSLDHLFAEMEMLYTQYGVREFHFVDDMFNASKARVMEFCRILDSKNWNINYTFPNGLRLNTIDAEMLNAMKKTGAYAFTVGIESGSQRILDLMNKKLKLETIREKLDLINNSGLEPSGFFIVGFPGETKEDLRMTLRFAKSLPIKRAHFSNFLPLPGTEATRKLLESGEIQAPDWSDLCYSKVPYAPTGMTRAELKSFQRRAFLEFHLRPKILFKMLGEIRSWFHLISILKRTKDYLF
jgi:anaerobic magnesium-protoporphyrin IX monomethyl ester cyclase